MKKLFTFLLISCSISATAQWSSDTLQNLKVSDAAGPEEATPLMANTSDGKTYISWFENSTGNYRLMMQLLDVNGFKQWGNNGLVVSSFPQSTALYRYDLKCDNTDNAIVAFQDTRNGALQIVAYKLDSTGVFVWGNSGIELTDSLAQEGLAPVIGVTGSNDAIIAWNSDNSVSKWVSYQKITSNGIFSWPAINRIKDNVLKYSRPGITSYGMDDFLMTYIQETGNFPAVTSTIFAQHFDVNGNPVWNPSVQLSTKTTSYFTFPVPITDNQNGLYMAFNSSNPVNITLNDVYLQHVDSAGNLWSLTGTEMANSTTENKLVADFKLSTVDSSIWTLLQVLDGSQNLSGVKLQKTDLAGNVLLGANATTLQPVSADYYLPYAFADAGDGFISIYKKGGFNNEKLYGYKTDYSGVSSWTNNPVSLSVPNSNKYNLNGGPVINDQLVIVWEDTRLDQGVYAQNIFKDGSIGIVTGVSQIPSSDFNASLINPSSELTLLINSISNSIISINCFSITGENVLQSEKQIIPGMNTFRFALSDLSAGIYTVEIRDASGKVNYLKWIKTSENK